MRGVEEGEKPMPEINTDKVCFVIAKSRELRRGRGPRAGRLQPDRRWRARNSHRRQQLGPARNSSSSSPISTSTRRMPSVALVWIGRGDYEADDWASAVAAAADQGEAPTWKYLLGIPLLPDYLEDALSAFGRSCEDFDAQEENGGVGGAQCERRSAFFNAASMRGANIVLTAKSEPCVV